MPTLRLFAVAREAAGTARDDVPGRTVAEVLDEACRRYGDAFRAIVESESCRVWVNGDEAHPATSVADGDEVAVLPPVSGGDG
jgi:molybdopterin synthase sulfur carrier subunit